MMIKRLPLTNIICGILAAVLVAGCRPPEDDWRGDPTRILDARISLSADTSNVGDRVQALLEIVHPADSELIFDEPGTDNPIHVLHREVSQIKLDEERVLSSFNYTVTVLDLGVYPLFQEQITAVTGSGENLALEIAPPDIKVVSVLNEGDERADIREVRPFPARYPRYLLLTVIAALLAAAIIAIIVRRLLGTSAEPPPLPQPEPAHIRALRRLKDLDHKGWIEKGMAEPFYVELSSILRQYLEDRFELRAPEQTTEEFIETASRDPQLTSQQRELVTAFMQQSDLVKFARHTPGPETMREAFAAGERLIRETAETMQGGDGQ